MRIVIKIGTSTLAYATGQLNIRRVEALCKTIYGRIILILRLTSRL